MNSYTFFAMKPSEKYNKIDVGFLVSVILLWGFGLFTVFVCSQSYAARFFNNDSFYFVKRQLACSAVGFAFFLFFMFTDIKVIKKLIMLIVIVSFVLCVLTYIPFLSVEKNGARRWLKLPFNFTFQSSELVKFTLVIYLANYFEKQFEITNEKDRDVLPCVGVFLAFVIVVLFQKDFSTSIFLTMIGLLMFFVSGSKLKWFWPFLILAIPVVIIMIASEQYRIERIVGFLRPAEGSGSFNYQVNAAKNAISAGGLWGVGIGRGLSKLNSIPEVQADYIFAGWSESMGFVGVIAYLAMLIFFALRGYRAAFRCPSRFAAYGSFGCVSVIFLQSIINIMVVCGMLPSTGIPLPFFSVGGSSIIVTLIMCGFVVNASRCEESGDEPGKYEEVNIDTLTVL
ncbi:MAG: putative lipid II flippase FtsW [Treponema sp.]|nr:putative lipid II flippase FtsW [Treponema sp.]